MRQVKRNGERARPGPSPRRSGSFRAGGCRGGRLARHRITQGAFSPSGAFHGCMIRPAGRRSEHARRVCSPCLSRTRWGARPPRAFAAPKRLLPRRRVLWWAPRPAPNYARSILPVRCNLWVYAPTGEAPAIESYNGVGLPPVSNEEQTCQRIAASSTSFADERQATAKRQTAPRQWRLALEILPGVFQGLDFDDVTFPNFDARGFLVGPRDQHFLLIEFGNEGEEFPAFA